jgi:hypothetical protein
MAWELQSGNALKCRGTDSLCANRARYFPRVRPLNHAETFWRATPPRVRYLFVPGNNPARGERLQARPPDAEDQDGRRPPRPGTPLLFSLDSPDASLSLPYSMAAPARALALHPGRPSHLPALTLEIAMGERWAPTAVGVETAAVGG